MVKSIQKHLESWGGSANMISVTVLGGLINYLFEKPWLYDRKLLFPGIAGAIVGYTIGVERKNQIRSDVAYWSWFVGSLSIALLLYLTYDLYLVPLTGKPWWYDLALFPTFIVMNITAFCGFGLRGLKFTGKSQED
jgi:hypothetical protein